MARHLFREKPAIAIVSDLIQMKVTRQDIGYLLMDITGKYIGRKYAKKKKAILFYIYLGRRKYQEDSEHILFSECSILSPLICLFFEQHGYSAL